MLGLDKTEYTSGPSQVGRSVQEPSRADLFDDLAQMLTRQVVVYTAVKHAAMAERLDLPMDDFRALKLVIECKTLATGQLAHMLGISSGGATALINRLEQRGLVVRDRHPLDRRIIVIRPEAQAREAVLEVVQSVSDELAIMSVRYDTPELETARRFMADCVRMFKQDTQRWLEGRPERHGN
ncbi:Transcriptional regulator, MarR family [plant metagenome]|uniref:Transcriptional regulator, MarR family n=1 Tax=plant metagenome TaxID=1297885 RepID=A0A484P095_9ZZZZ